MYLTRFLILIDYLNSGYCTGKTGIVSWKTIGETVVESVNGEGSFSFHLNLYRKQFIDSDKVDDFPLELSLNDDIFVEVSF